MKRSTCILGLALLANASALSAQEDETSYAFDRFVGEWKLKNDRFQQVWDGKTVETLSIPGHRTKCSRINTDHSIFCVVDAVDFQGHILWAVQADGTSVSHLSHFGGSRLGDGGGALEPKGDLSLTIRFSDEPKGTYRHYTYEWVSADEYRMMSRQYDASGTATGNWYGGLFERVGEAPD
ncbi:MAG: hypothetical protein AAF291_04015 [Pseudomonadota bacterium]